MRSFFECYALCLNSSSISGITSLQTFTYYCRSKADARSTQITVRGHFTESLHGTYDVTLRFILSGVSENVKHIPNELNPLAGLWTRFTPGSTHLQPITTLERWYLILLDYCERSGEYPVFSHFS